MTASWKIVFVLLSAILAVANAGLVGGLSDADINEKGVQNALQFAVVQHNKGSNDMFVSQVSKVIKVQKQVVSGMKYVITVEMARTSCRKGDVEKVCTVHEDPQLAAPYLCTFHVWSQPWLNEISVTKQECHH